MRWLVVAAEDDDVLEHREAVGLVLVVAHAVGRGVDDFVVAALGAELLDQFEDRFALHHHARLAPEGVVVGGLALVVGVVVEVVHHNFDEPLLLGPLEDGFVQRRAYQLGNDGDDIDAHLGSRLFVFGFSEPLRSLLSGRAACGVWLAFRGGCPAGPSFVRAAFRPGGVWRAFRGVCPAGPSFVRGLPPPSLPLWNLFRGRAACSAGPQLRAARGRKMMSFAEPSVSGTSRPRSSVKPS